MDSLERYRAKRNFQQTPEPEARASRSHRQPIFVIQEHHASRLHYDFRLEVDGVLKSWAVPKEPSLDPGQKRLAVHVEDHPLAYADFKGTIPAGQYGAGEVFIWDRGTYENLLAEKALPQSMEEGLQAGRLEFRLHGSRLKGDFALIQMKGRSTRGGKDNWLLIKMKDEFARPDGAERTSDAAPAPRPQRTAKSRAKPVRATPTASHSSGGTVAVTHGEKLMYPDTGITKEEVFDFYRRIASHLVPFLRDRPATLERLPEGVKAGGPRFWQKNTPAYYPDWIPRIALPTERGATVQYALVNDEQTLLYLVNQGALTFHVWLSRVQDLDRPDFVLFDLDPGQAAFADVVVVARELHVLLQGEGIEPMVKTSGKTGLHILVPWTQEGGFDEARAWAHERAERVAETLPDQATVEIRKAKRGARVYLDTLQNARGHHVVPPYVLRAVPGAPVSTPLTWRELTADLDPRQFNLKTIFRRLARQKHDPLKPLLASFETGGKKKPARRVRV